MTAFELEASELFQRKPTADGGGGGMRGNERGKDDAGGRAVNINRMQIT